MMSIVSAHVLVDEGDFGGRRLMKVQDQVMN